MDMEISSDKWRPFCLGLNVLMGYDYLYVFMHLLTASLMTVLQDKSKFPSCPVTSLANLTNGSAMITAEDRSAELALMDYNISTCLIAFGQGRGFMRLVALIYVPPTVNSLRVQLHISGLPCADPGLVVYHLTGEYDDSQLQECALNKDSSEENFRQ